MRALPRALIIVLLVGGGLGCVAKIGGSNASPGSPGAVANVGAAVASARVARLSHLQWENTVQDLFGLSAPTGLSSSFTTDTLGASYFDNNEDTLQVTPGLWSDYQRAAETVGAQVTLDAPSMARFVPANLPADPTAKARAFISQFGRRAFRRPLSTGEVDNYLALFNQGTALTGVQDPFTAGVRITVQGMLQSPYFIYRVQTSSGAPGTEVLLNGYEVATRLSYMLLATTPSDALLDAAAAGTLDKVDGVASMARQMLEDPRAAAVVDSFHRQLFNVALYPNVQKSATLFPEFTAATPAALTTEHQRFVHSVVFEENAGLTRLLTAPYAFVNQVTAPLYGLSAPSFGADFTKVDLDPKQRAGLLTQAGFLALYGTQTERETIRRGAFINLRVLCANLPPPLGAVPPLPPPAPGSTDRERVNGFTGPGTCGSGCHAPLINPIGFGLENFNAAGKYDTVDNGKPIDASASYAFDGVQASYVGPVDLMGHIAASIQAHRCYAQNWLEFAAGRTHRPEDEVLLGQLAQASQGGANLKSILVSLAASKAIRYRAEVKP